MPKSDVKKIKKDINDKKIKNLYYFIGQNYFLMENFTDKIFKIYNQDYKNSIDYLFIGEENLNFDRIHEYVNTLPITSEKKLIYMNIANMDEMKKEFYDEILKILNSISEFCIFIIHDLVLKNNKKNIYYNNFLKKICELAEFCEFKNDSVSSQKQAILWAKSFGKKLNKENSKIICEKCLNNMDSIKMLVENICLSSSDEEISISAINKLSPKFSKYYSVFDVSKSIRNNDLVSAMKITNSLLIEGEEPMKIFSIIKSDFVDALRIQEALKQKVPISEVVKIFKYNGKEFKLKYAEILCKKFNIDAIIEFLYKADSNIKSFSMSQISILESLFINLKKYQL